MKIKNTLVMLIALSIIFPALLMATPNQATVPLHSPNVATLVLYENVNSTGNIPRYYNFTTNSQTVINNRTNLTSLLVNTIMGNYTVRIDSAFLVPQVTVGLVIVWNFNGTITTEYSTPYQTNVASGWGETWRDVTFIYPLINAYNIHGNYLNVTFSVYEQLQFPIWIYSNHVNFTNGIIHVNPNPNPNPNPIVTSDLSLAFLLVGVLFLIAGFLSPVLVYKMYKNRAFNGAFAFCVVLVAFPMLVGIGYELLISI